MESTLFQLVLPVLSIIIPVFATVYTVNRRIKEQNRENHQPYLVLNEVESLDKIDVYSYYLTLIGKNLRQEEKDYSLEKIIADNLGTELNISLHMKNIGYGVATNIKFYNLLTGDQIVGRQENANEINQKLFTTFDIASSNEKEVQANVYSRISKVENDHNRILCVYQDLNQNIFSFIISINIKIDNHYDFFAYQPSSHSYRKWIIENKREYKKILKKYADR